MQLHADAGAPGRGADLFDAEKASLAFDLAAEAAPLSDERAASPVTAGVGAGRECSAFKLALAAALSEGRVASMATT